VQEFSKTLTSQFSKKIISKKHKPYLVAEIGLNHNNDLDLAKKMIDAAFQGGANAVKFQSYITKEFIHPDIKKVDELFRIFQKYQLSLEGHFVLSDFSKEIGIDFFSTPLSLSWVKFLYQLEVPFFKIASGDVNNFQLLEKVVQYDIPIIISLGAAHLYEIDKLQKYLLKNNKTNVLFNHCVSMYPTPMNKLNLEKISFLENRLNALIGFSDHTEGWLASFSAVISGAVAIEKHFTLDKNLDGPDHKMSSTPDELSMIRKKIDEAYEIRGSSKDFPNKEELESDYYGKRSLYQINNETLALRPRHPKLSKDSDWIH